MVELRGILKLHVESIKFLKESLPADIPAEDAAPFVTVSLVKPYTRPLEVIRTDVKAFLDANRVETLTGAKLDATWDMHGEVLVCHEASAVVVEVKVYLADGSELAIGRHRFPATKVRDGSELLPRSSRGISGVFKMDNGYVARPNLRRTLKLQHAHRVGVPNHLDCNFRPERPCSCAAEVKMELSLEPILSKGLFQRGSGCGCGGSCGCCPP